MDEIDPLEMGSALARVPLFREIQRLLAAQQGPVNWEIAQQVASAVSAAGRPGAAGGEAEREELEQACRIAEMRLAELTGMEAPAAIAEVAVFDRAGWADSCLRNFEPLVDRLAQRLRGTPDQEGAPLESLLDALGPLLLGLQVGFLAGYLSRRVLGQYDFCYPTGEPGRLYFVYPNIVEVESELQVDPRQFRMWLALHEVAHRFEFQSIPWTQPYLVGLLHRYIDAAEVDSDEVMHKLQSLSDPEQLQHILEHPDRLLPLLVTPSQQSVLTQIQAFMSVMEGYAEWAMNEVGAEILAEFEKIGEGMRRRRAERSSVEKLLEQLLGLDLKLEQYRAGERFVATVAKAGRVQALWEGPGNLPSLEELDEPGKWLDRVGY